MTLGIVTYYVGTLLFQFGAAFCAFLMGTFVGAHWQPKKRLLAGAILLAFVGIVLLAGSGYIQVVQPRLK